jgi:hypothetical protein
LILVSSTHQRTILELSRWGRPLLREHADDQLPYSALLLGLKTAFHQQAAADLDEIYDLEVEDQRGADDVRDREGLFPR